MALLVPNEGEILLLQYCLNMTAATNPIIHLYKNNVSLAEGSALGSFTEVTEAGYVPMTLGGTGWTVNPGGGSTAAEFSAQTFSLTTGATVYGYYVTDGTGATVLWAEVFSGGPYTLPTTGGTIVVSPKFGAD